MNVQHNQSSTRLYRIWYHMKRRCLNPKDSGYKNYGGRGITVCDSWQVSFTAFEEWAISNGYQEGLQIDRINNDGNYEPGNCRWTTYKQQSRNKRTTRLVTAFGETKCIEDWAVDERCVVRHQTLWRRLVKEGWSAEEALTTPANQLVSFRRLGAMGEVERQCRAWMQATGKSRMTYFRWKALGKLPDAA